MTAVYVLLFGVPVFVLGGMGLWMLLSPRIFRAVAIALWRVQGLVVDEKSPMLRSGSLRFQGSLILGVLIVAYSVVFIVLYQKFRGG